MKIDNLEKNPYDKAAHDIYSLYFIGWIVGFLAFIIGFILALRQHSKRDVPALYQSHYTFQMSIALQGFLALELIVIVFVLVTPFLSLLYWWRFVLLLLVAVILPIYWWLKRCIMGFKLLHHDRMIINPLTFGWPKSDQSL